MILKFITISRQAGSMGDDIAKLLAIKCGMTHITRDYVLKNWFPEIADRHELHMLSESPGFFLRKSSAGLTFQDFLEKKLSEVVKDSPAVISGLGAQIIFRNHPDALHIKIIGSLERRIERLAGSVNLTESDAQKIIENTDRRHRRYIQMIYGRDWSDPDLYQLTINTDTLSAGECAELLSVFLENRESFDIPPESENKTVQKPIIFKNQSGEEFAKVLDMYNLEWDYEPRTFPLKWDSDGNITQAFSPDFYLPRFDTYIELTIMNQKYTSTKKKKMELLKKLYPGTNISIVYKNDYHNLIRRFAEWGEDK
jgi:cytidylate kinase